METQVEVSGSHSNPQAYSEAEGVALQVSNHNNPLAVFSGVLLLLLGVASVGRLAAALSLEVRNP